MTEQTPVKYDPKTRMHTPYGPGETIPASMAPVRVGQADYYPENHISPPLLPGKHVWLNDPQPFLYDKANDQYVMWYLYNEDDDTENGTAWREVITKDFVTFTDNGIRIPKYTTPYGDVWSGSPFLDTDNIFGFGAGAVLFYITMPCDKAGPGSQSVALWVAKKGLGHNPEFVDIVAPNSDGSAFRDPKVFLGDDKRTLYMLIAVQAGIAVLSSMDGKTWKRTSTLSLEGLGTIECPDLIKIDNQQVLIFSANGYLQAPTTTQTMFLLVNFSNGVLTVTQPRPDVIKRMCVDTGPDFYAGRCGQTAVGDNIMVGWANNWNYAANLPIADFNGVLAAPRLLSLHTFSDGYVGVVGSPVVKQAASYPRNIASMNTALNGDYSPIPFLDVPESCRVDFTIRKDPNKGWPNNFGIFIGSGDVKSFSTAISMTGDGTGTGEPYIENTRNDYGARPNGSIKEWNEYYRVYLDKPGDSLQLTYIIDRGTAEVFINGVYAQTFQVLWPVGAQYMRLSIPEGYTLSGDCTLYYNRRAGRVNGAFTRAHADSIYMFNTVPVITSYDGDSKNPNTKRILQICQDTKNGPFFQTEYNGPYTNFWQISPDFVDLLVYSMSNEYVEQVRQIFVDKDPEKGVGVKTSYGSPTIYLVSKSDLATVQAAIDAAAKQIAQNTVSTSNTQKQTDQQGQQINTNVQSIQSLSQHIQDEADALSKKLADSGAALQASISDVSKGVSQNSKSIDATNVSLSNLRDRVLSGQQGGSPNTVANPALLDRYVLQPADVLKFLQQSAEQKAQGLAYAGKYSLTPQVFTTNADGLLKLTPYGAPPTDGIAATSLEAIGVPIITDSCSQFYDKTTGIHYRWDQFQANSQKFKGVHWDLDGPVVSVSLDGLKWVCLRTILYNDSGAAPKTAFFIDRDNTFKQGAGTLIVSGTDGTYAMTNLVSATGKNIGQSMSGSGDHRIYNDPDVFKNIVTLGVNSENTHLIVRTGLPGSLNDAFSINHSLFSGLRVECPSWVPMNDQVDGPKLQVLAVALQPAASNSPSNYEGLAIGAGTYTTTGMTFSSDLRWAEWGACAYAHVLVDPMQQDGTGGTRNGCDIAVLNNGSYNWRYINRAIPVPHFGFGGGQWLPADVVLRNGIPFMLPSAKFKQACQGRSFSATAVGQGTTAVNPGWTLGVTHRSDVWRAEMYVDTFTFTGTSTIRFHFGTRWVDYIFSNGTIDFQPANSGTTVIEPNTGGQSARVMPMTRSFVQGTANTLVWEYDNGRIRLYNTATGETMSEIIFPDGMQLSTIEVLGNDFFVGGFTFAVNQDSGSNY